MRRSWRGITGEMQWTGAACCAPTRSFGPEFAGAGIAGTDLSQVAKAVDAGGVAVGEINADGVIADSVRRRGFRLGLEHGEFGAQAGRRAGGSAERRRRFFLARVVARGAGAIFAQISEIIVARVTVGPDDIHARAGGDVDLHGSGIFARVERQRHRTNILTNSPQRHRDAE